MVAERMIHQTDASASAIWGERAMRRLDGSDLYEWGAAIRPLTKLNDHIQQQDALNAINLASRALGAILNSEIKFTFLQLRADYLNGLLNNKITGKTADGEPYDVSIAEIRKAAISFETIFNDELKGSSTYYLTNKKAYDIRQLVENGINLFPDAVKTKVPEAVNDLAISAKCMGFELWTAAAFHLHRANELIIEKYWTAVSNGAKPPHDRMTMGQYVKEMIDRKYGNEHLLASLRDLVNLHRNPLIHRQDNIYDVEELDALFHASGQAIYHMLKAIPDPALDPVP